MVAKPNIHSGKYTSAVAGDYCKGVLPFSFTLSQCRWHKSKMFMRTGDED